MAISKEEFAKEENILAKVQKLLNKTLEDLGESVSQGEDNLTEFKKMIWENASSFDEAENMQAMSATSQEAEKVFQKQKYYQRLCQIKKKPY